MNCTEMEGILVFIKRVENLKNTFWLSFTSTGKRESSAEHSWRFCLMVMLFSDYYPDLNREKCFKLAVIHDLAEAICDDTPAIYREKHKNKMGMEQYAFMEIIQPLPEQMKEELCTL